MTYFSMFSGIGGFELGIQNAFEGNKKTQSTNTDTRYSTNDTGDPLQEWGQSASCVGYSEIDKYADATYQQHFGGHRNYGDATKINARELPDFDLLVGGFPCQAFSIAGKRKGFDDTRGTLFFDIARILAEKRPRHLVLENVKGLLSHDAGKTFQTILGILADLGYRVEWQVLNSKDFGVPQNRERVFIIGHFGNGCRGQVFPIRQNSSNDIKQRVIGGTLTSRYPASQREGTYIKKEGSGRPKIRKLTPLECERLQGFPDDWTKYGLERVEAIGGYDFAPLVWKGEKTYTMSDTQRYKMCGNAVTVNVVESVTKELLRVNCL